MKKNTHHDEFKLAQVIVRRDLECLTDYSFKDFITNFTVGVAAIRATFLQYFV